MGLADKGILILHQVLGLDKMVDIKCSTLLIATCVEV